MTNETTIETLGDLDESMSKESVGIQVAGLATYFLKTGASKADVLRMVARASVEAGVPTHIAAEFARVLCGAGKTLADCGVGQPR